MNHLTELSLVRLSERLAAREVSSVEAAMAYLSRMTVTEPRINAYITPTARIARRFLSLSVRVRARAQT